MIGGGTRWGRTGNLLFAAFALHACGGSTPQQAARPVMDLESGVYDADIFVTITTQTVGAAIHYTTNGTTPTAASAVYTAPVAVAGDGAFVEIQAVAVREGLTDSDVATESYAIVYGGSGGPTATPTAVPPSVTGTTPDDGAVDVAVDGTVEVTFNVAMDGTTITASTFRLRKGTLPVDGTVSYAGTTATFTPDADLDPNGTYIASLEPGITDASGNPLVGTYAWVFSTVRDYSAWMEEATWVDQGSNYAAPGGATDAYYPSVLFDEAGFGGGSPAYSMWYTDGSGGVFRTDSSDGENWGAPTSMTGIAWGHHIQVLYDADCFGAIPCEAATPKFRAWYWDNSGMNYAITDLGTAESADGVAWTNAADITQDPAAPLVVGGGGGDWNRGTYGPVSLFYQAGKSNSGTEPFDYTFVMYYNGTDGAHEDTGLAYSADGLYWHAYAGNPVLSRSGTGGAQAWDCYKASYGTVLRDSTGFHYFYSGGGVDDGGGGCTFYSDGFDGIGHATSADGKSWTRDPANPIFHVSDGVSYRLKRSYTPAVVDDGSDVLRMFFSAKPSSGAKTIGLAVLH